MSIPILRSVLAGFKFVAAMAGLLASLPSIADQPLRIVVPYGPGPGIDAVARILATQYEQETKQTAIVENKPGAGTVVGSSTVAQAVPDGLTLLINGSALPIGAAKGAFKFDAQQDLVPVVRVSDSDSFLVAAASTGIKTVGEMQAYARQKHGGLNCVGLPGQYELACRQLRTLLNGAATPIIYPGAAQMTNAVLGGDVDVFFASRSMLAPLLKTDRIRVIATASGEVAGAPFDKLPLLKQTWPAMSLSGLVGLYAPKDTPKARLDMLNKQMNQVLSSTATRQAFENIGLRTGGGTREELGRLLAEDVAFFRAQIGEGDKPAP